jgi:hypothetical protein
MTTYPHGTLLRFSATSIGNYVAVSLGDSIAVNPSLAAPVESAAEWLAICIENETYPSVEAWLATIPGTDITHLEIHMQQKAKAKAEKAKQKAEKEAQKAELKAQKAAEKAQAKEEKALKAKKVWNVPKAQSTQKWAYHVYTMIRESGLDREDVRDAYNRFVDCLLGHNLNIRTSIPWAREKYETGIELSPNIDASRHGIRDYVHIAPRVPYELGQVIFRSIYDAYHALFLLIEGTVVPYMRRMSKKRKDDYNSALYMRALTKAVADHQKLVLNYQLQEAYLRNHMEKLQRKLDAIKGSEEL